MLSRVKFGQNVFPITLSLLLHFYFLKLLLTEVDLKLEEKKILSADIVVLPAPKPQIVSPSVLNNKIEPKKEKAKFLSEQNNSVLEETVKRGEVKQQVPPQPPQVKAEKQKTIQPKQKTSLKPLNLNQIAAELDFAEPSNTQKKITSKLSESLATTGVQDYLPTVREGEITLLNTKASKYAVFVRRVALQVFNEIKRTSHIKLNRSNLNQILQSASVDVKLDRSGEFLRANLSQTSGAEVFDSIIFQAAKDKARDPHPPSSALNAEDEFHFIFQASMKSYRGGRWLVLRVGLR